MARWHAILKPLSFLMIGFLIAGGVFGLIAASIRTVWLGHIPWYSVGVTESSTIDFLNGLVFCIALFVSSGVGGVAARVFTRNAEPIDRRLIVAGNAVIFAFLADDFLIRDWWNNPTLVVTMILWFIASWLSVTLGMLVGTRFDKAYHRLQGHAL